jgi:outer membrane protein
MNRPPRCESDAVAVRCASSARLIGAQRDRVIAAYALLSATGRLDVKTLGLHTPDYAPEVHYHQVRDAWHGLRTPAGQ